MAIHPLSPATCRGVLECAGPIILHCYQVTVHLQHTAPTTMQGSIHNPGLLDSTVPSACAQASCPQQGVLLGHTTH